MKKDLPPFWMHYCDPKYECDCEVTPKPTWEYRDGAQNLNSDGTVCFWYPQMEKPPKLLVDLVHVRSVSPIRVTFDFEGNEWVIEAICAREEQHSADDEYWKEMCRISANADERDTK